MDIASTVSVPASAAQASTGDAIAITILRRALDLQAQSAAQLLAALPQPAPVNPPNLGRRVDSFA
jgi:hypothetical protein